MVLKAYLSFLLLLCSSSAYGMEAQSSGSVKPLSELCYNRICSSLIGSISYRNDCSSNDGNGSKPTQWFSSSLLPMEQRDSLKDRFIAYCGMAPLWYAFRNNIESYSYEILGVGDNGVNAVAVSPDKSFIVTGSDCCLFVWDTATRTVRANLKGHEDNIHAIAISADGKFIVTGSRDGRAYLWNAATGKPCTKFMHPERIINAVAISSDNTVVIAGCSDSTIYVWDSMANKANEAIEYVDVPDGRVIFTLKHHSERVTSVAISQDGSLIASGSVDKTTRVWCNRSKLSRRIQINPSHGDESMDNQVNAVAISPDKSFIVIGCEDGKAAVWDIRKYPYTLLYELNGHNKLPISSVAISQDGSFIVTGSWDCTACIWNGRTGKCISRLVGHEEPVIAVGISFDGRVIVTGAQDNTRVWTIDSAINSFMGYAKKEKVDGVTTYKQTLSEEMLLFLLTYKEYGEGIFRHPEEYISILKGQLKDESSAMMARYYDSYKEQALEMSAEAALQQLAGMPLL
jgi:WD40 repeat protein